MRRWALQSYIKKRWGGISFSMEYDVYWKLKCSCIEFFGDEKYGIFEQKSWWKYDIYWLLKISCFDLFGNDKYGLFLGQKVAGKMIFPDCWKVLVLTFLGMENMVFFWIKKLMERWYLLITEKFLFWSFREWKIRSFLSRKVDGKMIFTVCWEVLVLNFLVMGNTALFSAKNLMERWYLLGLFYLSMIFQDLGNMALCNDPLQTKLE